MLSSRVFHRKLPLKGIESRPKFIVLIRGSLHKFICCLDYELHVSFHEIAIQVGIQSIPGFEDFCYEFLQLVNIYGIASISGE